jgi:TonB family protein
MARLSQLEQRFAALLSARVNRRPVTRRKVVGTLVAAASLIAPLAAVTIEDRTSIRVQTANLPATRETPPVPTTTSAPAAHVRVIDRFSTTDAVTTPEVLEYGTPPLYSDEARARRVEGRVVVQARVDARGGVQPLRVVKGLGLGLDQNALVALRQWKFLPGTRNGAGVEMVVEIDVEFSLRNEAVNELIANDMAMRVGPGVTPPRAVRTAAVGYPDGVAGRDRRGTVVLDVVLMEDGTPKIVRILRSMDADFDERAVQAFEQWRFSPAMKDGRPVRVRMNAEVNFHG